MRIHPKIKAAAFVGVLVTALQAGLEAAKELHIPGTAGTIITLACTLLAGYQAPHAPLEQPAPEVADDAAP